MARREKAPFDGKLYDNRPAILIRSLTDVLKWKFGEEKAAKWPRWIQNQRFPAPPAKVDRLRVTFINHATCLVQTPNFHFLTDPVYAKRVSPISFAGPARVRAPGVAFEDLPRIDAVLVSHNHYDHLDIDTLVRLQKKFDPVFYVAMGDKALLQSRGISKIVQMDWWDRAGQGPAQIQFFPAQHWSGRGLNDRRRSLWGSFGVEVDQVKIYFAGDTGHSVHFQEIQAEFGAPDLALLPIGAYLPRWFMRDVHMDPADAVQAYQDLKARFAMGIHHGTFQLTDEQVDAPVKELALALKDKGVEANCFFCRQEGDFWQLEK